MEGNTSASQKKYKTFAAERTRKRKPKHGTDDGLWILAFACAFFSSFSPCSGWPLPALLLFVFGGRRPPPWGGRAPQEHQVMHAQGPGLGFQHLQQRGGRRHAKSQRPCVVRDEGAQAARVRVDQLGPTCCCCCCLLLALLRSLDMHCPPPERSSGQDGHRGRAHRLHGRAAVDDLMLAGFPASRRPRRRPRKVVRQGRDSALPRPEPALEVFVCRLAGHRRAGGWACFCGGMVVL